MLERLTSQGYTQINCGSSRIVLRFPEPYDNLVVKLARYGINPTSIGMWQNHNEVKIWDKYLNSDIPLNPVYDWQEFDFKWVVMPYGKPATECKIDEKKLKKVKQKLSKIEPLAEEEFVKPNFIVINNEYHLADYGSLERDF